MNLTSEHFTLAGELMEYLVKGEQMYSVDKTESKADVISVTTEIIRDKNKEIYVSQESGMTQFFAEIHFVLNDESRGTMQVSFCPIDIMLINLKTFQVKDPESFKEDFLKAQQELDSEIISLTPENTLLWSKCLMNYVGKGNGVQSPNSLDSMLGLKKVSIKWNLLDGLPQKLVNLGDTEELVYQCSISYMIEGGVSGVIIFQVMPYEITFSSL